MGTVEKRSHAFSTIILSGQLKRTFYITRFRHNSRKNIGWALLPSGEEMKDFMPLQAADRLAYETYKHFADRSVDRPQWIRLVKHPLICGKYCDENGLYDLGNVLSLNRRKKSTASFADGKVDTDARHPQTLRSQSNHEEQPRVIVLVAIWREPSLPRLPS